MTCSNPPSTVTLTPDSRRPVSRTGRRLSGWLPAMLVACGMLFGCGSNGDQIIISAEERATTFLCTETGLIIRTTTTTPPSHPETGKATLVPALYCSRCEKWQPMPPAEELQRNPRARQCRQGHPLERQGPLPEGSLDLVAHE